MDLRTICLFVVVGIAMVTANPIREGEWKRPGIGGHTGMYRHDKIEDFQTHQDWMRGDWNEAARKSYRVGYNDLSGDGGYRTFTNGDRRIGGLRFGSIWVPEDEREAALADCISC